MNSSENSHFNTKTCNVVVAGQSASGKSTLIETVSGNGTCRNFLNFIEINTAFLGANEVHNIWYCLDCSNDPRLEDIAFIRNSNEKLLVIITKSDLMNKKQIKFIVELLSQYIDEDRIVIVSSKNGSGLTQLLDKTQKIALHSDYFSDDFQHQWNEFYKPLREIWQKNTSDEADSYIQWASGRAAVIALSPLPLSDTTALVVNEMYMIYKLAQIYGVATNKNVITTILGCSGGTFAGKLAASMLPGLKIPIAAGITYGVGKAAKAYFESGMTLTSNELKENFLKNRQEANKIDWNSQAS